jgi:hypothetical protein
MALPNVLVIWWSLLDSRLRGNDVLHVVVTPRKRGSRLSFPLDSRFRGNDVLHVVVTPAEAGVQALFSSGFSLSRE